MCLCTGIAIRLELTVTYDRVSGVGFGIPGIGKSFVKETVDRLIKVSKKTNEER
ncbi:MAG: hypothetical protein DF168_01418 [Candidatus Moanabacter tarae]|uniref:Uncharacterized protein n=1 Tax=Candidatus Moanibacter tarae TaxID=2200854 RepID=A0A2Z4AGJ7_9BACT|nr:MAG: hypothetical protein DF168_01418 [Candidatus Moanabacter tarae]